MRVWIRGTRGRSRLKSRRGFDACLQGMFWRVNLRGHRFGALECSEVLVRPRNEGS